MIKINAVGDISLGPHPLSYGSGIDYFIRKYGVEKVFVDVRKLLNSGDINFGNIECVFSNSSLKKSIEKEFLRADPKYVHFLKEAGFNVLNTINNHALDHGKEALIESINVMSREGISVLKYDNKKTLKPTVIIKNGNTIGFLSFCLNLGTLKSPFPTPTLERICENIKVAKEKLDVLVLSLHWGYEFTQYPSKEQVRIAHKFVNCGADIILGHHPHTLHPVEIYKDRLIIYSMGNFIFDLNTNDETCLFHIILNDDNTWDIFCTKYRITRYGVPMLLTTKKIKITPLTPEQLIEKIPKDYERYVKICHRKAKFAMLKKLLQNMHRYDFDWYKWYLTRKYRKIIGGTYQ